MGQTPKPASRSSPYAARKQVWVFLTEGGMREYYLAKVSSILIARRVFDYWHCCRDRFFKALDKRHWAQSIKPAV
jgi:hypothetical protein